MSLEPKVEDLLASIRKAIDNDLGGDASSTRGESRGTLMRGALREMRISLDNHERLGTSPEQEIADLRGRILRKSAEAPPIPPPPRRAIRPSVEPPQRPRDDFRRIMGTPRQTRAPDIPPALPPAYLPEPPVFRGGSYAQDDLDDIAYAPLPPQQQRNDGYHDPYGSHYAVPPQPALMSRRAEAQTTDAFRQLTETLLSRATGGRAIEDLTTDLLRSMLKQWLDENLPILVERLVRDEIERVARRGR